MTGPDETMMVAAGTAKNWDELPAPMRAALERHDGPYERRMCSTCANAVVVGREARAMLDGGRASGIVCTECLIGAAMRFQQKALQ